MSWNIHPGEILREEFMKPHNLSARKLALTLGVTTSRINDIILERRGVTADTAIKLANFFGTTPKFWMNMQVSYELKNAENSYQRKIG